MYSLRKESGHYPPGAEFSPNAPWNQYDPPEEEVDVEVEVILTNKDVVLVTDYEESVEEDEDGKRRYVDTTHCDVQSAWEEQRLNPAQIMQEISKMYAKYKEHGWTDGMGNWLRSLAADCVGWEATSVYVERDEH